MSNYNRMYYEQEMCTECCMRQTKKDLKNLKRAWEVIAEYKTRIAKLEELFKEAVVKNELAKARIAALEAERDGLRDNPTHCGTCKILKMKPCDFDKFDYRKARKYGGLRLCKYQINIDGETFDLCSCKEAQEEADTK